MSVHAPRSDSAADSEDEASEIGLRVRDVRESLGLSVPALAIAAGVARTHVYDAEAGRRFVKAAVVDALRLYPSAQVGNLVEKYEELRQRRAWRLKRPDAVLAGQLAAEMGQGFPRPALAPLPDPPDLPTGLKGLSDPALCVVAGIHVLEAAARLARPTTIMASRIPFELTSNDEWQDALMRALDIGCSCLHILDGSLDRLEQAALLRQGLRFVGLKGQYRLVLTDPGVQIPSFVVAEGVGALQFFSSEPPTLDAGIFFPSAGETDTVAKLLISQGRRLEQAASPFLTVYETVEEPEHRWTEAGNDAEFNRLLPAKIRLDLELTEAESRPADRLLVKSGLLVATMPPEIAARRAERWKRQVPASEAPLIDILLDNRRRRWNALRSGTEHVSRDICTKTAIEAYLRPEFPATWAYQLDPFYSGKFLDQDDRIAHVRALTEMIRSPHNSYTMGLADTPEALASPVGNAYWELAGDRLFFFSFYRKERPATSFPAYLSIGAPELVKAFRELADLVWEELPADGRDQRAVVGWLEQKLAEVSVTRSPSL